MFSNFDASKLELLYLGLKYLIENGKGKGFHNNDLGHPVYHVGADGKTFSETEDVDSPDKNRLFIMLSELTKELKKQEIESRNYPWWYEFSDWQKFCQFAIDVHEGKRP